MLILTDILEVIPVRKIISLLLISVILCFTLTGCDSDNKVKELYFTDENGKKIPDGEVIEVEFVGSYISYQLNWKAVNEDGSAADVEFIANTDKVIVSEFGLVTFLDRDITASVAILAKDGSEKKDIIMLVPKLRGGGNIKFE